MNTSSVDCIEDGTFFKQLKLLNLNIWCGFKAITHTINENINHK